jgi:hypothetical protein
MPPRAAATLWPISQLTARGRQPRQRRRPQQPLRLLPQQRQRRHLLMMKREGLAWLLQLQQRPLLLQLA